METESLKVSIEDLLSECRNLWRLACEHERLPAHAAFAVFSANNPFIQKHDATMGRLLALRAIAAGEVELVPSAWTRRPTRAAEVPIPGPGPQPPSSIRVW